MAPVLVGMFANSPMAGGAYSGSKSARSGVWHGVDPSRTGILTVGDGPSAYLEFALNAGVLLHRGSDGYRAGRPGFSFRDWVREGAYGRFPTLDDWHYHLTTLFPQVRPRGYFELRCIDSLPVHWRSAPVALSSALLMNDQACQEAIMLLEPHCENLDNIAMLAARGGLAHPVVARLAQSLMAIALEGIPDLPEDWISPDVAATLSAYDQIYTARARCPADDIIDSGWALGGAERPPKN